MIARTAVLAALLAAACPLMPAAVAQPVATAAHQSDLTDEATGIRLGLGAQQLAAAGLSAQQTSEVLEVLLEDLNGGARTSLSQADDALRTARRSLAALELATAGGQGDEGQLAARSAASAAVASCQASVDGALTGLFEAAISELSGAAQTRLTTMRSNLEQGVLVQFTVRSFDEGGDEWTALRAALNDERASAKSGLEANSACQVLLTEWRSNEAVAAAKANLDSNLTAIQAAWDATFTD
jgi:hypothetical protein